jgi:hypothetical protein
VCDSVCMCVIVCVCVYDQCDPVTVCECQTKALRDCIGAVVSAQATYERSQWLQNYLNNLTVGTLPGIPNQMFAQNEQPSLLSATGSSHHLLCLNTYAGPAAPRSPTGLKEKIRQCVRFSRGSVVPWCVSSPDRKTTQL